MSEHAKMSPSSAHRWLRCPGSVVLGATCPEEDNEFASEGTAAHELAATALESGEDASAYLGRDIYVADRAWTVNAEMASAIQQYLDYVRSIAGKLMVEHRTDIKAVTGELDAAGTLDALILADTEVVVVDLKYGRGVQVDARDNEQLMIYALGVLAEFDFLNDYSRVRLSIVQPRLNHISEWSYELAELYEFAKRVKVGAERCVSAARYPPDSKEMHEEYLAPGDTQCRWCRAKAICPALAGYVLSTMSDDFVDVTKPVAPRIEHAVERTFSNIILGNLLGSVDLIETWCKAIRAKAEAELLVGHPVPGYKLVEGRRGARCWSDDKEVEGILKAMRLRVEEMYDMSLISPTTAEKLRKAGTIGPRQWPKLQRCITQSAGKPSVALESDKRPALVIADAADDFDVLTTGEGGNLA